MIYVICGWLVVVLKEINPDSLEGGFQGFSGLVSHDYFCEMSNLKLSGYLRLPRLVFLILCF
ncbi:hypothetical protein CV_0571 [Chromobacterium violaceum ATCC 12472]|uniref:Uncharacterized protein n=1 Tax=Chromobacterium violaceum (strain ATCC 12472 / DSM 30191 / JCM 1249 / CCUG 213 / NBRC 12614 / NCIMB 9131 / NCTC 9757 / MK) TaxID=243365 RepID=Q7P0J6_CHRVO|nr:hypothetical protein CV_0571 [Chromobacterium violaceum ATCC 12472]